MRFSAILTACFYAACGAQEFLLVGTEFTSISPNCPISGAASASVDMLIWAAKGADVNQTEKEINEYFDNKPPAYTSFVSNAIGLMFWEININSKQACDIAQLAGVSNVATSHASCSSTNT